MLLRYVCRYQLLSFHCVIFVRLLMPHSISRFFLPAASRSIYSLTKRNRIFFFVINWKQATERVRERGNFLCGMKSIELNKRVGRMSEWDDKKIVCMYFYYLSSILARSLLSLSLSLTHSRFHPSNVIYHYYLFVQVNNTHSHKKTQKYGFFITMESEEAAAAS